MEAYRKEEYYKFSKSDVGKSDIPIEEFIEALTTSLSRPARLGKGKVTEVVPFRKTKEEYCISSWKFRDWDYVYHINGNKDGLRLPSLARGLFTYKNEIICRGYDKFFNYNEVDATKYDYLAENFSAETTGEFEVTLKANGCIIFISSLDEESLLICSKHSTGYIDPIHKNKNHALQAEKILNNQLKQHGIDSKILAKLLSEMKVTLVCEYCDDNFEEHVLRYQDDDKRGLYLHGINFNIPEFRTFPMNLVERFGEMFGFLKIDWFKIKSFDELWKFLTIDCQDGLYKNEEVEGFVIRKNTMTDPYDESKKLKRPSSFFFKYKFDEPYLMYREWREATKKLIKTHINNEFFERYNNVTQEYLKFVNKIFEEKPVLKLYYKKGHGIIALRCLYLESIRKNGYELTKDRYTNNSKNVKHDILMNKQEIDEKLDGIIEDLQKFNVSINAKEIGNTKNQKVFYKYVIIGVATPGCGKTVFFQTLTDIFPDWGIILNDNLTKTKKQKNKMEMKIIQFLSGHDRTVLENKTCISDEDDAQLDKNKNNFILIDKNNHMLWEREFTINQLIMLNDLYLNNDPNNEYRYELKFACVNFLNEKIFPNSMNNFKQDHKFYKFTTDRIILRGENHQSIRIVDDSDINLAKGIAKQFINRFQPIDVGKSPDSEFELVIDLNIYKSIEYNVLLFIDDWNKSKISEILLRKPSDSEIQTSFKKALDYKPKFVKFEANSKKKEKKEKNNSGGKAKQKGSVQKVKKTHFTYFGALIDSHILMTELEKVAESNSKFCETLDAFKSSGFVFKRFHVTFIHRAHKQKHKFDRFVELFENQQEAKEQQPKINASGQDKTRIKIIPEISFDVILDTVVWDERCITVAVKLARNGVNIEPYNQHIHITIAVETNTKPVYSNSLLDEFFKLPENFAHVEVPGHPVLYNMPLMGFV